MININLLPKELQKKKKKSLLTAKLIIPLEVIIGLISAFVMVLLVIHTTLIYSALVKISKHKNLEGQWNQLLPAKQNVDAVITKMRLMQNQKSAIEKVVGAEEMSWAQKLNIISNELPKGVWLHQLNLTDDVFFIYGSAISRQKKEMTNMHDFTANLKQNTFFLVGFSDLELGSIQRRKVSKTELVDFLITVKLKQEDGQP